MASTAIGIEGVEDEHEAHARVADDDEGLAEGILDLLADDELRSRLGRVGHERWRQCYAPEHIERLAIEDCENALGRRPRHEVE